MGSASRIMLHVIHIVAVPDLQLELLDETAG